MRTIRPRDAAVTCMHPRAAEGIARLRLNEQVLAAHARRPLAAHRAYGLIGRAVRRIKHLKRKFRDGDVGRRAEHNNGPLKTSMRFSKTTRRRRCVRGRSAY